MERFIIVSSGVNCVSFIHNCLKSVQDQQYINWKAIFIDDGSTDRTADFLHRKIQDERFIIESYQDNRGAAYRRWNAIKKHATNPEDIILLLGLDDQLRSNCLNKVLEEYNKGKWMTYGNWIDNNGDMLPSGFELDFDEETHANRDYRKVQYRSTAPNTFKRFLFDQMKEEDFMVEGEWIRATTESSLMFSCLEMCGKDRIGIIREPIYIYNRRGSQSTRAVRGRIYQNWIYNNIISREKKPLYEKGK